MSVDYIDNGNDDGTNFGRSDEKIGFYGLTTPVVKPSFTAAGPAATATTTTGSTVRWGFTESTQADACIALANEIRAKLVAFGLINT